MDNNKMDIGPPRDFKEIQDYARILRNALYLPDLEDHDWVGEEGIDNFRLIRIEGKVVGGLALQRMGQWFGGNSISMGAIRYVGVSPAYRSSGVAHALLLKILKEMRDNDIHLSTLYPSTQTIYRRVGYERAGTWVDYRFPARGFARGERPLLIRQVDPFDRSIFQATYNQHARHIPGRLDRNPWLWERVFSKYGGTEAYLFEGEREIEGYVVYSAKRGEAELRGDLLLQDLVALTPQAIHHMASFFADHQAMVEMIHWQSGPNEPLFHLVAKQEYKVFRMLHWMLRLVNVEKALTSRGYPSTLSFIVHLAIIDDVLEWNNGRFILEIANGCAKISPGGRGSVRLDVRGLATLYSGFLKSSDLRLLGLAEGDEDDFCNLDSLFSGPSPWMSEMF